jgi:spore coat polysaccharide biosynthesis protein SpsF (cytidylyltransferase family)
MLIDKTAQELNSTDADCILWRGLPIGASPVGIRASALEKICSLKETTNTETGWTKFFTETGLFKVKYLDPPDAELADKGLRLTLDYPEDLELFEQIFDNLDEPFDLRDIVRLLHKNPRLQRINDCVKAIYDQNFASKSTEVRLKDSRQPKL